MCSNNDLHISSRINLSSWCKYTATGRINHTTIMNDPPGFRSRLPPLHPGLGSTSSWLWKDSTDRYRFYEDKARFFTIIGYGLGPSLPILFFVRKEKQQFSKRGKSVQRREYSSRTIYSVASYWKTRSANGSEILNQPVLTRKRGRTQKFYVGGRGFLHRSE